MIGYTVDISSALAALDKVGNEEKIHQAVLRGGEIVRAEAVSLCPVDTGGLRQSITVNDTGTYSCEIVATGSNEQGQAYAIFVEYGTGSKGDKAVAHTTKTGWVYFAKGSFHYTTGQAPQPFMVPALKSKQGEVIEVIKNAITT